MLTGENIAGDDTVVSCQYYYFLQSQYSGRPLPLLSSDLLSGGRKESEAAASFPVVLTGKYRP